MIFWNSCKLYLNRYLTFELLFLRYGDESSADDKEEEVKEPDHGNESLQSLVYSTRFSFICSISCFPVKKFL